VRTNTGLEPDAQDGEDTKQCSGRLKIGQSQSPGEFAQPVAGVRHPERRRSAAVLADWGVGFDPLGGNE
jgi:hypothetical protein